MQMDSIGQNIRKYRLLRHMRQEDLAEKTDLTANYIGMVERGEKILSLEFFIGIANVLEVSADMLLADVLHTGYEVKHSLLAEKLNDVCAADRETIYDVIDTLVRHAKKRRT